MSASYTAFAPFIKCNEAPPDDVAAELRAVIQDSRLELERIQPRLGTLLSKQRDLHATSPEPELLLETQEEIPALSMQAMKLHLEIQNHLPMLSSLRLFPNEILSEIFVIASPSTLFFPNKVRRFTNEREPWTLSQVSRRWRSVAFGTPRLWSTIDISTFHLQRPLRAIPMTSVMLLEEVLRRSRDCDLDIRFTAPMDRTEARALALKWFEALVVHSERWATVNFKLGYDFIIPLRDAANRLPRLKSCQIDRLYSLEPGDMEVFAVAPSLFCADISDFGNPPSITLPWGQLRSLSVRRGKAEVVGNLLRLCPALLVLELGPHEDEIVFHPPEDPDFVPSELVHDNLSSLYLRDAGCLEAFVRMSLPSLKSLDLDGLDGEFEWLDRFLVDCNPPLTSLSFSLQDWVDEDVDNNHFTHVLSVATRVRALTVSLGSDLANADTVPLPFIIQCVAIKGSLPVLQALYIEHCTEGDSTIEDLDREFVDMVEARMTANECPLILVRVRFRAEADEGFSFPNLSDEDLERLKVLNNLEMGRTLSIRWFNGKQSGTLI